MLPIDPKNPDAVHVLDAQDMNCMKVIQMIKDNDMLPTLRPVAPIRVDGGVEMPELDLRLKIGSVIKSGGHCFGRFGRFWRAGRRAPQATKFAGGGVFTANAFSHGQAGRGRSFQAQGCHQHRQRNAGLGDSCSHA